MDMVFKIFDYFYFGFEVVSFKVDMKDCQLVIFVVDLDVMVIDVEKVIIGFELFNNEVVVKVVSELVEFFVQIGLVSGVNIGMKFVNMFNCF